MSLCLKLFAPALAMLWSSVPSQALAKIGCAALLDSKLTDSEIVTAEPFAAGAFTLPNWAINGKSLLRDLPAFCRVTGVIRPTADSAIGFELWLPDQWNGRYLQAGNGGFGGGIVYTGLIQGLQNGFAAGSTDDGHSGTGVEASWALGHPEKVVDYGYRAVHVTSVITKSVISNYYGRPSSFAYFSGCSNGGREALMEVQRFPDDFDGWLVGAPGNNWTSHMMQYLRGWRLRESIEPLTNAQVDALNGAALGACDASDGVADGVIDQPLQCDVDLEKLLCRATPDGTCFSREQVNYVRQTFDDVRDAKTQEPLAPGYAATLGVYGYFLPSTTKDGDQLFAENYWPFMVYGDAHVDMHRLDLLEAFKDARLKTATLLNATDPDLRVIRASGKKIIQYHGWADGTIPAQYSIAYYEAVEKYLGRDNRDFYRLFMVPGMAHCAEGPGPNVFGGAYVPGGIFDPEHHALAALIQWVEQGKAPDRIVATKYQDDDPVKAVVRTRPLCVYPKVARWTGKGSTNEARNFACE